MTRFILKNRIENPEDLKEFSWEGFEFDEALSDERRFVFINGQGRIKSMTEVEKMRNGLLADMSSPELQVRFEHAKKLLARMRGNEYV